MAGNKKVQVPGELEVVTVDGKLAPTKQIYDENYDKFQSELNQEVKSITDQMQISIDGGSVDLTGNPDDIIEGSGKVPNANAVAKKIEESMLNVDQEIVEDSTNPVSGGAVFDGLSNKQNTISDIDEIRSNAQSGAEAYHKPGGGIPKSDMSDDVRASLNKADSSIQEETDPTVPDWAKEENKPSYDYSEIQNTPELSSVATSGDYNDLNHKPTIPVVPTNVSAFTNDANYQNGSQVAAAVLVETQARESAVSGEALARQSADAVLQGFITNIQNALVNYYLKTETYSKSQVDALVNAIGSFQAKTVDTLPTPSLETTGFIYLVPSTASQTQNVKEEYITVLEGSTYKWEHIGSTNIDLSPYYTSSQTDEAISTALSAYTTTQQLTTLLNQKQDVIDSSHKLSADLVDDTTSTNKFTNTTEKAGWNDKYDKPQTGIPAADMERAVQNSLDKADTAEQSSNKVTSLGSSSTDVQYPSAKCVYDLHKTNADDIDAIEQALNAFVSTFPQSFSDAQKQQARENIEAMFAGCDPIISEAFAMMWNELQGLRRLLLEPGYSRTSLKLVSIDAEEYSSCGFPMVLKCDVAGAPAAERIPSNWDEESMGFWTGVPMFEGQKYHDRVSKKVYEAVTVTNSTNDWVLLN